MTEDKNIISPYKKGVDIPIGEATKTWSFILDKGKVFKDTAFVTGQTITSRDIDILKSFYQEIFDEQERNFGQERAVFNKSLREHLLLAERIAELGTEKLGLNTNQLKALMLVHDFGRVFSHRRGRNDAIEKALFKKFGFTNSFINQLPEDSLWTDPKETYETKFNKMVGINDGVTVAVVLFDVLAKWKNKEIGKLRDWEDVVPETQRRQNPPEKNDMWPTEFKRQSIVSSSGQNLFGIKYNLIKNWFEKRTKIQINNFIKEVETSLVSKPLTDSWK